MPLIIFADFDHDRVMCLRAKIVWDEQAIYEVLDRITALPRLHTTEKIFVFNAISKTKSDKQTLASIDGILDRTA